MGFQPEAASAFVVSTTEATAETNGSEKKETQAPATTITPAGQVSQISSRTDSTARSVKYNYLFYLILKLKYGEVPPSELMDAGI